MLLKKKILLIEGKKAFWHRFLGFRNNILYGERDLPKNFLDMQDIVFADSKAFELIPAVYEKLIKKSDINVINSLFEDEGADLILQRSLGKQLKKIFISYAFASKSVDFLKLEEDIDFIPININVDILNVLVTTKSFNSGRITIPKWFIVLQRLKERVLFLRNMAVLNFFSEIMLVLMPFKGRSVTEKRKYKYGMFLRRTDGGISDCPSSMDFLIKEGVIKKEDVIFVMDGTSGSIGDNYLSRVSSSGYTYCLFSEMKKSMSKADYYKSVYKTIKKASSLLASTWPSNNFVAENFIGAINIINVWEMFYSAFSVAVFIGIQEPGSLARVLWQHKHTSRYYFINISSNVYSSPIKTYYSKIIGDKFISSRIPIRENIKMGNMFAEYVDIGIINADFIRKIRNDPVAGNKIRSDLNLNNNTILITVFDDNSDSYDTIPFNDSMEYLKMLLKLLEDMDKVRLIYKPRALSIFKRTDKIKTLFDQLKNHPRCSVISNNAYSSMEIMAISDLIVTVPLSSTFTEALSAGLKTIGFVCSADLMKKYSVNINRAYKIFAYDYTELLECVKYWLSDQSNEAFKEFNEQFIKNKIDPYCDGQATKRLRELFNRTI